VLFGGAFLYHSASKDTAMVDSLSKDCPNDWIERNLYSAHSRSGILLMLVIDLLLFGPWGLVVWGIQMIWVPFFAAGVVNGLAHFIGYKNYAVKDTSRNLWPIAFWIGGEELHSNHHADGASAKFSKKWWEFDIGWMYICVLRFFKLATVR
jgi:stearoyl-CoA desaturase (delta-9 desaturase)